MKKAIVIVIVGLACLFTISTANQKQGLPPGTSDAVQPLKPSSPKLEADLGKMPLYFIANKGQLDERVAFYVQGKDISIYLTSEGLTYVLTKRESLDQDRAEDSHRGLPQKTSLRDPLDKSDIKEPQSVQRWTVKLDFIGANPEVRPAGEEMTDAVISYFKGKPEEWKSGMPTYSKVVYANLWPGIDLVYSGTNDKLKYEFVVRPGADPEKIRLAYRGASGVSVNEEGQLEVETPLRNFQDEKPVAYQNIGDERANISLAYHLEEAPGDGSPGDSQRVGAETRSYSYGFRVGDYDRTQPLILDPAMLVYCGYIGGSNVEYGQGIAVDTSGNAYIAGYTASTAGTFPDIVGPDLTYNGDAFDAFIAKVKSNGTGLVYCGYIGGSSDDCGLGVALDNSRNAYITGCTASSQTSFPVSVGPDLTFNGGYLDAFVAKVKADGTGLVYCGYIGGSGDDYGNGIAVDWVDYPYVVGYTDSDETTFPITTGQDHQGDYDAFVAETYPDGTGFYYCRFIGGTGRDMAYGVAVDRSYNAYIIGSTDSSPAQNFPVAVGPDLTLNGGTDAFVIKLYLTGINIIYCGYVGGSDTDIGFGIAVDSYDAAYITGQTSSSQATFPDTIGPDLTYNGGWDAFVGKVKSDGTGLTYCGYVGGSGNDHGQGIAVDRSGYAYIAGYTWSDQSTFPVTSGPDLTYNDGGDSSFSDAFIAKVRADGTGFVYCGYIGGDARDRAFGIAVSGYYDAYVTGHTTSDSATFPAKVGPDLSVSGYDAFVAKIYYGGKDDYVGTWTNGVYYRNSDTGKWIKLESSPATQIAVGDLDGDYFDDMIGTWPGQPGVWVKYSENGTWAKLDNFTPDSIAAGDVNGDGREDFLGSWSAYGVFYRDSLSGAWTKLEKSPALQISAGDLDGDGRDDLVGIWSADPGVWVKYSGTGLWAMLDSAKPSFIAAGDMSGDLRDDLLGSWSGLGVYYKNMASGLWVKLEASAASKVGTGDLDGEGKGDLLGTWTSQPGAWVKYSGSGIWAKLDPTTPTWFTAGKMRSAKFSGSGSSSIAGAIVEPPRPFSGYTDLSSLGPGGSRFVFRMDKNARVGSAIDNARQRRMTPGPGEPGFKPVKEKNSSGGKNRNLRK